MISLTYSYLLMDVLFCIIFIVGLYFEKNVRLPIIIMSLALGILGLFLNQLYIHDWWLPLTLSGSIPAFEDFLYGFAKSGTALVIFSLITKKNFLDYQRLNITKLLTIVCITATLFFTLHFIFSLNTFIITISLLFLGMMALYFRRPYSISAAILSGIVMVVISSIVYAVVSLITPGWIESFWSFTNVPHIIVLWLPIDDFIYYLLVGSSFGPLLSYCLYPN